MKIAIIGAGISGISAGRILQADGHDVAVFEKGPKAGGLVRCDRIDGYLFHRTGGHVFNAKDEKVLEWFWSHFDKEKEFTKARRNARIWFQGKYIGYPIENFLFQLDRNLVDKILDEILELHSKGYRDPFSYDSFSDFLVGNFGNTLYESYFKPYNLKIWKTDLGKIPLSWLEGKLPMPDYKQILLSNIKRQEESTMVHSSFFYPKEGGSQFIIDRLAEGLDISYNSPADSIEFRGGKWLVNDQGEFNDIVFTGDVRSLGKILSTNNQGKRQTLLRAEGLKSNGTSNMLCETDWSDLSWLYLPEEETRAHRIIYTGNLSSSNNGDNKRNSCVVEFSGKVNQDEITKELPKLPGNLKPVAYNYEPNSYVIQDKYSRKCIEGIKSLLEPDGFYLTGRFAEWEYYNMDKAIEAAMKVAKDIKARRDEI